MPSPLGHALLAVLFVADPVPQPSSPISGLLSPPPACSSPEYRQFDFWLGEWDVSTPQGAPAGTNRVERILEGCALQEHWEAEVAPRAAARELGIPDIDG